MADEMAVLLGLEEPSAEPTTAAAGEEPAAVDPLAEPAADPPAEPPAEPPPPAEWSLERIRGIAAADWTPELLTSAGDWLREHEAKWARTAARASKLDRKARERTAALEQERLSWTSTRDQMIADARALRQGTPEQRLDALARVTGLEASQVLEELTVGIADPKRPKPAALDPETKARIDRLEKALQDRVTAETEVSATQLVTTQLGAGVKDAERFPALAAVAQGMGHEEAARRLLLEMTRRNNLGQRLTVYDMLVIAEHAEARRSKPQAAAVRETATKPDAGTSARRPATSVTPRMSDAPATSHREKTPEEWNSDFAKLLGVE